MMATFVTILIRAVELWAVFDEISRRRRGAFEHPQFWWMFEPGKKLIGGIRFAPRVHRILIEYDHAADDNARPRRLQQILGGSVNVEITMQETNAKTGAFIELVR